MGQTRAVESHRLDHRRQAELLLDKVLSARRASQQQTLPRDAPRDDPVATPASFPKLGMRVGIAGPPGAGKSSFIEVGRLGRRLSGSLGKAIVHQASTSVVPSLVQKMVQMLPSRFPRQDSVELSLGDMHVLW